MPDTGLGTTLVFTTSSTWAPSYIDITPDGITRGDLSTSHLGTTGAMTFTPEELYDAGGFTATFFHSGDDQPPYNSAPETITITDPLQSGWSVGPKLAATGYVNSYTPAAKTINGMMIGSIHVKFADDLTFTDHS